MPVMSIAKQSIAAVVLFAFFMLAGDAFAPRIRSSTMTR